MSDLRPEVLAFARAMEAELRENDHKGGWEDCGVHWLLDRMTEERRELTRAVEKMHATFPDTGSRDKAQADVLSEAADVANFAMMVADVCGGLAALRAESPQAATPTPTTPPPLLGELIAAAQSVVQSDRMAMGRRTLALDLAIGKLSLVLLHAAAPSPEATPTLRLETYEELAERANRAGAEAKPPATTRDEICDECGGDGYITRPFVTVNGSHDEPCPKCSAPAPADPATAKEPSDV